MVATKRIVIDPGHGGWDPGRIAVDGVPEAYSNWALANSLAAELAPYDVEVRFTHEGAHTSLDRGNLARELAGRSHIANAWKADLLLSLHHDGHSDSGVRGGSLWVWSSHVAPDGGLRWEPARDGLVNQNHTDPKSIGAAKVMVPHIRKVLAEHGIPWRSYGDRDGVACSNFGILRNTAGPAILLETYYGTNELDVAAARTPTFITDLARSVAAGVVEALGLTEVWSLPTVKVVLPGGHEVWGELRGDTTWVPIRAVADSQNRTCEWVQSPPTVIVKEA